MADRGESRHLGPNKSTSFSLNGPTHAHRHALDLSADFTQPISDIPASHSSTTEPFSPPQSSIFSFPSPASI